MRLKIHRNQGIILKHSFKMKFLIILHLAMMCQAQNINLWHLNMKLNRLTRITDGLQKDVSDILTVISTSGFENLNSGNKTRTINKNNKGTDNCNIAEINGTLDDVKVLKTAVEELIVLSRNGFKNEKEFQREAIMDLKKSNTDFQTNLADENANVKHNVEELNTKVTDLQETSKNMSDNIQETNNNNLHKIENLTLKLNDNIDKTVAQGVTLESMKTMLDTLSAKQSKLEEENKELRQETKELRQENKELRQDISGLKGELTVLQATTLCEKNWTRFNSHCYLFMSKKQSWDDALATCRSKNSYLIEINSDTESMLFAESDNWSFPIHTWVGATNIQEGFKGTFVYEDSKLAVPEKFWNKGEPNNHGGHENCVHMFKKGRQLKLNDCPCAHLLNFICEKPGILVAQ